MKNNRSDSSLKIRNHLKKNFVIIPDITDKVSLTSYIRLARNLYNGALAAQQNGNFRRAYIDLYKFQKLTLVKIPTHRDFQSNSHKLYADRKWLDKFKLPAMQNLEQVVEELDREEDIRLINVRELEMIDEFEEHSLDYIEPNNKDFISEYNEIENTVVVSELESFPDYNIQNTSQSENIQNVSLPNVTVHSDNFNVDNQEIAFNINNHTKPKDVSRLSILKLSKDNVRFEEKDLYQCRKLEFEDDITTNENIEKINKDTNITYDNCCLGQIEASMLLFIGVYSRFIIPQPSVAILNVIIGLHHYNFHQDDYHTSYASFLTGLSIDLQLSKPAVEMNRCFFIHTGIATGIHPFALQCAFRILSFNIMKNIDKDDFSKDILSTVLEYCGFVDANALCFLWPVEFDEYRISFISGSLEHPIISSFQPASSSGQSASVSVIRRQLKDVIIRCSGDHFTILRPINFSFQQLLNHAKQMKLVVQINEINPTHNNCSIQHVLSNFSIN